MIASLPWASRVAAIAESLREQGVGAESAWWRAVEQCRPAAGGAGPDCRQQPSPPPGNRRGNPRPGNLRDRVLDHLRASPVPLTPQQLTEACATATPSALFSVRAALRSLAADGLAERAGWAEGNGRPRISWRAT